MTRILIAAAIGLWGGFAAADHAGAQTPSASGTSSGSAATTAAASSATATSSAAAKKDEIPLWPTEKRMLELTNAERSRLGLSPLTLEKSLLDSARNHCFWMASARSLQHTTAMVAENIAMGQSSSEEAVTSWMNSPGHRANMLGSYSRIGAAAYRASDGNIYWCLQFSW